MNPGILSGINPIDIKSIRTLFAPVEIKYGFNADCDESVTYPTYINDPFLKNCTDIVPTNIEKISPDV